MKILAIDPSTHVSGWSIGQDTNLQQHGYITASSKEVKKRIIKMRDQLSKIIKNNKIDKIIMQEVRPDFGHHTTKILIWLQAVIVITAYEINPLIEFEFINPSQWRAALKIKQGRGVKRDQVKNSDIQYVKNKYNITVNDDQADAICIFDAYWEKFDNEINWE